MPEPAATTASTDPSETTKGPRAMSPLKRPKAGKNGKLTKGTKAKGDKSPRPDGDSGASKPHKEVDAMKLDHDERAKRLSKIYKLERAVEKKKAAFETASKLRRAAKAELEEAEEAMELEIREQRFGPGPLFSGKDGAPIETLSR